MAIDSLPISGRACNRVLQCVAACCSVLQYVAVCHRESVVIIVLLGGRLQHIV